MIARYVMIGGFLGAGKTTSITRLADYLTKKGYKVGLITNDQGLGLVDTALVKSHEHPVREIGGGCFCCRFNSLVEAARSLQEDNKPDVFIAEPVGSCTDLMATVCLPMSRLYGDDFVVTPLSVVMDPIRAMNVLGILDQKKFSKNVLYIYQKQLEEAELLVINKCDLVEAAQLDLLKRKLLELYPDKRVVVCSAKEGEGVESWFDLLMSEGMNPNAVMAIDYERYGKGEAMLGWLNATLHLNWNEETDGNEFLKWFGQEVQRGLEASGCEVAHLKMTLGPMDDPLEIAAGNLVRSEGEIELSHELMDPLEDGELILNLRAEGEPEVLNQVIKEVTDSLSTQGLSWVLKHQEYFKPGKPVPVYRDKDLVGVND
ncbi:MAG: GTP-binding protein [Verrucomicrobiota bacterium]